MNRWFMALAAATLCLGAVTAASGQDDTSVETIIQALVPDTSGATGAVGARGIRGLMVEQGNADSQPPAINIRIDFAYNSAALDNDALITLRRLGTALTDQRLAPYKFLIAGYTDAQGSDAYNMQLSKQRADAVRDFLVAIYDMPPDRLLSEGHGKNDLLDPNNPNADVNRRVQIVNVGEAPVGQ